MLPAVRTDEEWQAVVWDEEIVRPAAEDLAARLGLAGAGLRRYPEGSRPVYAVGDRRVLKLYPTVSAPDSVTEARVLEYLHGRLPVATPELLACGEYENGWRYVLMSQLPGTELAAAWPAIPRPHQDRVVSEAGEMLAALHGLDPGTTAPDPRPGRLGRLPRRPARDGPGAPARGEAPGAVAQPDRGFPGIGAARTRAGAGAAAHRGDREHLLVNPGTWTLSGLLDFETAMTGDRAYEFAAAGLFVPRGDPRLLGRLLAAYGRGFDPRELLAYTLLHVHSNLPECLRRAPGPARAHPGFPGPDLVRYRLDLSSLHLTSPDTTRTRVSDMLPELRDIPVLVERPSAH